MKKVLLFILSLGLSLSLLTGCSGETSEKNTIEGSTDEAITIKIGATPEPHSTLLNLVVDDLKKEGIKLEIVEFTDYITPNMSLDSGDIDANFFQHKPYLDDFVEKEGLDLVSLGAVHIEPLALYSSSLDSVNDLKDGAEIAVPNDTVNGGRALLLLESNGLIKLDDDAGLEATENDIVENPKNLKINPLEAAFLPRALDEVDAAVINGNYALDAGLNPVDDGLLIEGADSPYVNIIAVRNGEEEDANLLKVLKAIQSEEVKTYIEKNYEGGVIPVF